MALSNEEFVTYYTKAIEEAEPYLGTVKYTRKLRKIYDYLVVENNCEHQDDLLISMITKYWDNYSERITRKTGKGPAAEMVFKIKYPWWLRQKAYPKLLY